MADTSAGENPYPSARERTPWQEVPYPFLSGEAEQGSISLGNVTNGTLLNAHMLPLPAKNYAVLPRQRRRGLIYSSDGMIGLLKDVADHVAARHRRLLWLGNLGKRGGGDIPWSVSHNSGRDADIAFCYVDPSGAPVTPPDLLAVDDDGHSIGYEGHYRFDPVCTWTIVRTLLTHRDTQIQYLFIANALKRMLLKEARKVRESAEFIELASSVLGQPGLALPHNDHLHVRIYCSKRAVEGGCRNTGRIHPWVDLFEGARTREIRKASSRLSAPSSEERARARERLVLLRDRPALSRIAKGLDDDVPRVRSASAAAVGALGSQRDADLLIRRFHNESDPAVEMALLHAMVVLGGGHVGTLLGEVIADPKYGEATDGLLPRAIRHSYLRGDDTESGEADPLALSVTETKFSGYELDVTTTPYSVRLGAIEAAADSERPEPVAALIGVLTDSPPLVRARAARALRRLTNHSFDIPWADSKLTKATAARGANAWEQWFDTYGTKSRGVWLAAGLSARGYAVPRIHRRHIWEIVRAIADADYLSYNAQRVLTRLSGHETLSLTWPRKDALWHWTRWFQRRRGKFHLSECPATLAEYNR